MGMVTLYCLKTLTTILQYDDRGTQAIQETIDGRSRLVLIFDDDYRKTTETLGRHTASIGGAFGE